MIPASEAAAGASLYSSQRTTQVDHLCSQVTLLGNILVDKRFTLQTTPFVGMEYFFPNSLNLRDFKSLRLRMRTDGNVYKVKMLIASSYDFGNHEVHGYVVDKSQQWETYELPFERF